jgi:hypothetical protein
VRIRLSTADDSAVLIDAEAEDAEAEDAELLLLVEESSSCWEGVGTLAEREGAGADIPADTYGEDVLSTGAMVGTEAAAAAAAAAACDELDERSSRSFSAVLRDIAAPQPLMRIAFYTTLPQAS